jgi:ubiquinone/menaquinone biosynthesis C-methylase UbiE
MTDIQSKITAVWDRAAERYDTHTGHGLNTERERRAWTDALRALLAPPPADVLEVGAGTGAMSLLLASMGYRVRGIDLSEKMVGRARQKATDAIVADVRFEIGDALDPSGAPVSCDVVFNRHLIHMLTDPGRALANWHRLLRPGGRVVIIDGLWGQDPNDRIDDDVQAALPLRQPGTTTDDIRALAAAAGFVDVTVGSLDEIDRIERELSTEEDATDVPHYVITGDKS